MTLPDPVVQSVASPTADPTFVSLIQARFHTFMETDLEIVCFVALRPNQQQGHGGTVSSPNHTFFLGKLEQADNQ